MTHPCKRMKVTAEAYDKRGYKISQATNGNITLDGCNEEEGNCGCQHAESNLFAKLIYCLTDVYSIHISHSPCFECARLLQKNLPNLKKVTYDTPYRKKDGIVHLNGMGIDCYQTENEVSLGPSDFKEAVDNLAQQQSWNTKSPLDTEDMEDAIKAIGEHNAKVWANKEVMDRAEGAAGNIPLGPELYPSHQKLYETIKLQSDKGKKKYNEDVAASNLTMKDFLQHSREEQIDRLIYTQRLEEQTEQIIKMLEDAKEVSPLVPTHKTMHIIDGVLDILGKDR